MPFCEKCGNELKGNEKFCSNCGSEIKATDDSIRKTVYEGEIHKCPNCGEIIKSFEIKSAEINKLAADIASWLKSNGYSSTDDVFAFGGTEDVDKLIKAYTNFANDGYVFNKTH